MLKKWSFYPLFLAISTLTACSSTPPLIGQNVDSHHCLTAAGYQWSQLQQQCIRIFESGIRLLPINPTLTSAAFIVFKSDQTEIELFVPEIKHAVLLKKETKPNQWQADQFKLIKTAQQQWQLYTNHTLSYQSELKTIQDFAN